MSLYCPVTILSRNYFIMETCEKQNAFYYVIYSFQIKKEILNIYLF